MELIGGAVAGALALAVANSAGEEAGRFGVASVTGLLTRWRRRRSDQEEAPLVSADNPEQARQVAEEIIALARHDEALSALLRRFVQECTGEPLSRVAAPYGPFVDRREQLAQARGIAVEASQRPQLLILLGQPGMGTSALARQLAAATASQPNYEQLYVDLGGDDPDIATTPAAALTDMLSQLQVDSARIPAEPLAQRRELRRQLAGRTALILLDNAHSADQVIPLLTGAPGSLTLVTASRRMPALVREHGARVLHVGPLAPADGEELLAEIAGRERFAAGGAVARDVAWRCAGHPRTLREVGAWLQMEPELSWQQAAHRLAEGTADSESGAAGQAYVSLSAEAMELHRLLGRLPRITLDLALVAALADCPEPVAHDRLAELTGWHLLETGPGPQEYRQPPTAHRHAVAQRRVSDAAAIRRWAEYVLRTAVDADTVVMRGRWYLGPLAVERSMAGSPAYESSKAALSALRPRRPALVAAVRAAAHGQQWEVVWQLCEAMWGLHLRLGFHEDCLTTHALGIHAARECGDRRAEARMRVQRGFSQMALRRFPEAEADFMEAARLEPVEHARGRATAEESLGLLRLRQERFRDAEVVFRGALAHARQAGDPRALALLAHHLGRAISGQRRYQDAREQLTGALDQVRALPTPDPYNEGRVLTSVGETLLAAGDLEAAAAPLDAAMVRMEAAGALTQQAHLLELRARCEPAPLPRRELWERAEELYRTTGDTDAAERARLRAQEGA